LLKEGWVKGVEEGRGDEENVSSHVWMSEGANNFSWSASFFAWSSWSAAFFLACLLLFLDPLTSMLW
jgi:hypothetical protein